ncbi:hypothetical protein [Salinigranum halophilum]|nr:hypothetical protein [Salinigranum halophilum]
MNPENEVIIGMSLAGICAFAIGAVLNNRIDIDDRETVEVEITVQ